MAGRFVRKAFRRKGIGSWNSRTSTNIDWLSRSRRECFAHASLRKAAPTRTPRRFSRRFSHCEPRTGNRFSQASSEIGLL